jgi:hypothetical protein
MKFDIIEIGAIETKTIHSMVIELRMNKDQMYDALAVICEELGCYEFKRQTNNILGFEDNENN